jgi:hypothetical protein
MNTLLDDASEELLTLLGAFVDGQLSDADESHLLGILRNDASARAFYLDYMEIHAGLDWRLGRREQPTTTPDDDAGLERNPLALVVNSSDAGSPWLVPTFPTYSTPFVGSMLFSYLVAAIVMSFGLGVFSVLEISKVEHLANHPVRVPNANPETGFAPALPQSQLVGQITGIADCVWKETEDKVQGMDENAQRNLRSPVGLGDHFALHSGLLEITYNTGAKVILQGPVTYQVDSRDGGYLSIGKLTVRLEKKEQRTKNEKNAVPGVSAPAPLFAVRTPTVVVTDLGTEFGVSVNEKQVVETHVFEGTVQVARLGDDGVAR